MSDSSDRHERAFDRDTSERDSSAVRISRRDAIAGMLGLVGAAGLAACDPLNTANQSSAARGQTMQQDKAQQERNNTGRLPVGYVGHGAPTLVFDREKGADLRRWADQMPRPSAILVVSAHWQDTPVSIGTTRPRDLMYDFYGFPQELYEVEYNAPVAPDLADRVAAIFEKEGTIRRKDRAFDHGVWVPLVHMAPSADIPVLQLSLPSNAGPAGLFELGRKLAPLRDEGVLILGSGALVHNLRRIDMREASPPESWASEFDQWAKEALSLRDFDRLVDFRNHAPGLRIAHPTLEHFEPILVAAGAASVDEKAVSFPVEGFEFGNLSRRCVQFG